MIPISSSTNIVFVGNWNRMIFTPQWVGKELFHVDELAVDVPLFPTNPIRYRGDEIDLHVGDRQLIFIPKSLSQSVLEASEAMAVDVARKLPDTPVKAIGVNISYSEDNIVLDGILKEIFSAPDKPKISSTKKNVTELKVGRTITTGKFTLNVMMTLAGSRLQANFNFHKDCGPNARDAAAALDGQFAKLLTETVNILQTVYSLKSSLLEKA